MHHITELLNRFRSDERGAFAIIFGLLAIVLIATAGAVVDFTAVEQGRSRAQDALDSAALGLQPTIYNTPAPSIAALKVKAQNLLAERLSSSEVAATVDTVTVNTTDGTLHLEAQLTMSTSFVALVGVPTIRARIVAEATRKRLNIEVAMVLDNSGSMNNSSRMTNLKAAANCATNILFNSDCNSTATSADVDTVKIGIVPFTSFVNVGTGYASAAWMEKGNGADLANDNFDTDDKDTTPFTGAVNRFNLYSQLSNVTWQGCVEARKYPYDTNDVTPTTATPDTLFVPEFAPDEPSSGGFSNSYLSDNPSACYARGSCSWQQTKTKCNRNAVTCTGTTTTIATYIDRLGVTTSSNSTNGSAVCTCSSVPAGSIFPVGNTATSPTNVSNGGSNTGSGSNRTYVTTQSCNYEYQPSLNNRELQERMCKYTGSISTSGGKGPNWDCPTNAMQPLTNTKSSVKAAITAMYPQGYTNIHQGAVWGFHMLSPTEPLTEGRAYTTATYKVMIIMTDGENTYDGWNTSNMNGGDSFWAYGYPWNNQGTCSGVSCKRMRSSAYNNPTSESQLIAAMNTRTVETCNNAKASPSNITIYTIGLNSPNNTTTQMLKDCSSGTGFWYFPTQSSELTAVFKDIASQLSNLRLAK